jgi:hypothetical protein
MVELGNARFFFDFGSGMRNVAIAVPLPTVNDIFTHLHA